MTWNRFILAPETSVLSDFELPNPQKADFTPTAKIPTHKKPQMTYVFCTYVFLKTAYKIEKSYQTNGRNEIQAWFLVGKGIPGLFL